MTSDQIVILLAGIAVGFDLAVLVHVGGQMWDDRRLLRRAEAPGAALDAEESEK